MQLIHQNGERLFVSSLDISNHFGKQHKDVLRAIRDLDCSESFNRRNFALVEYQDAKGEKRPAYEITRDGFVFLCMGFTGPQAALWKERYIDAFNRMEAALRVQAPALAQDMTLAREVGQLKDALAATQQTVAGLVRQLMQAKDREIRLLRLRQQEEAQRRIDRVILLEAAGTPRAQIVATTGLSFNYVRQIVFRARRDGHRGIDVTPRQGDLMLEAQA
ncbi:MAG: Rha family transcriptional regulator [Rhodocyclaceae bacterium]|nr:Rha family transcriptional regulator [Rhodocyclaceae bacterium]